MPVTLPLGLHSPWLAPLSWLRLQGYHLCPAAPPADTHFRPRSQPTRKGLLLRHQGLPTRNTCQPPPWPGSGAPRMHPQVPEQTGKVLAGDPNQGGLRIWLQGLGAGQSWHRQAGLGDRAEEPAWGERPGLVLGREVGAPPRWRLPQASPPEPPTLAPGLPHLPCPGPRAPGTASPQQGFEEAAVELAHVAVQVP